MYVLHSKSVHYASCDSKKVSLSLLCYHQQNLHSSCPLNEIYNSITCMQAQLYMEDFQSERSDREVAHGKIADCEKQYAHDIGELKAQVKHYKEQVDSLKDQVGLHILVECCI